MVNKRFISVILVLVLFFACSGMVFADVVLDPTIMVTAPTAGEKLMVDSTYVIKWDVEMAGFYQLSYSVDNGATWSSINSTGIKLGHFETGSYFWKVPATPSSKVLIRASNMPIFGDTIYYNNSEVFSIIGVINVLKPPGVITFPPAAPSNLTATMDLPASVVLTWTDNSSNETSFIIYRTTRNSSYEEIGTTAADINTFTDTTAKSGIGYYYKVKARNSAGTSDFSNEAAGFLLYIPEPEAPSTPTNLKATALSSTEVRLTWTDQASDEDGFYVERNGARVITLGSNASSFTDTNLTPGTEYEYRVQAYNNDNGESAYSNIAAITTPPAGATPLPAPEGGTVVMYFYVDNTDYFINGALNTMDAAPTIFEGRTVLPIKYVAEPLGAFVGWDPGPRRVRVTHQSRIIDLWIGNNRAEINGNGQQIDPNNPGVTPVILPPGRTMLPLRFIAEQMGAKVEWDPVQRRVTITYPAP
jgi:hypothetical protein